MSLINCPECGIEVSDNAVSCPKCGYPFNQRSNIMSKLLSSRKNQWAIVVGVVVIILLIILKISLTNNEKSNYIPSYDSYSSISNRDASSIFNNLVITNLISNQSKYIINNT